MTQRLLTMVTHTIFSLLLILAAMATCSAVAATAAKGGFSMELIHRDSPRSPSYPGNLTHSQRLQRLIQHAKSRNAGGSANTKMLRPPLTESGLLYMVKVSIGSGKAAAYYTLHFDIGSSVTWVQCTPCNPCFRQPNPTFDTTNSPTYNPLPHDHRLCIPPYGSSDRDGLCTFETTYAEGTTASGLIATERFAFLSDRPDASFDIYQGLAFGCVHSSNFQDSEVGDWDGILGMGSRTLSLPAQLSSIINNQFSYCLVPPELGLSSFVRFGSRAAPAGGIDGSTQILTYADAGQYYLALNDISVGDTKLGLPPGTFERSSNGDGGFVVDTGSAVTHLTVVPYLAVEKALMNHLRDYDLEPVKGNEHGMDLDLCYKSPNNMEEVLPYMVFHFEGADYRMEWENVFLVDRERGVFCWAALQSGSANIFGAHQQSNSRFLFDLGRGVLSFSRENCDDPAAH